MALSKEQRDQLKELQRLEKEPDAPRGNVNFSLDLGNDVAWERGKKLGLFSEPAEEDDGGEEDDDEEDAPKRRSYFGN